MLHSLVVGCVWFIWFFCPAAMICAAEPSPVEVAGKLQEAYDSFTSFAADFQQVASVQMSRRARRGEGRVVIVKPGSMRWDYKAPDEQVIVSDGKTISMYFAKTSQMIKAAARDYVQSDVLYSFFAGTGKILDDFQVLPPDLIDLVPEAPATAPSYRLKLIPKESLPQVEYLHLWIDRQNYYIIRLQIVDQLGSVTDMRFANIAVNRSFPKEYFTFVPPEGTEVVHQ